MKKLLSYIFKGKSQNKKEHDAEMMMDLLLFWTLKRSKIFFKSRSIKVKIVVLSFSSYHNKFHSYLSREKFCLKRLFCLKISSLHIVKIFCVLIKKYRYFKNYNIELGEILFCWKNSFNSEILFFSFWVLRHGSLFGLSL